jgi:hypothetical protein
MVKTLLRFALLRVLPRRILPIVTVVEAALFLRSIRRRFKTPVNPPTASRTAAPRGRQATTTAPSRGRRPTTSASPTRDTTPAPGTPDTSL